MDGAHFALTKENVTGDLYGGGGGGGAGDGGNGGGNGGGGMMMSPNARAARLEYQRRLAAAAAAQDDLTADLTANLTGALNLGGGGGGDADGGGGGNTSTLQQQAAAAAADLTSGSMAAAAAAAGGAASTSSSAAAASGGGSRILAFKHKAPAPPDGHAAGTVLAGIYSAALPGRSGAGGGGGGAGCGGSGGHYHRAVPQTAERVLDAPDLLDDYYLNLLDWSSTNTVAVALGPAVFLWNATTGSVEELMPCGGADGSGSGSHAPSSSQSAYVTSVAWAPDGTHLAVGTSDARVQIWDAQRARQVRELAGEAAPGSHTARVSALAWNGGPLLSSGGRDSAIANWDVRKRKDQACVAQLRAHEQEVCGLKWNASGSTLASGGNDNLLCLWGGADFRLQHRISAHCAAVKALAWCPFQANLLASGGGTADRHIRLWNGATGACVGGVDTGSQVCALQWSRHDRELLSSHGYARNQLALWRYPSLTKVAEMTGHAARVLHMAQSPDGSTVVTAGADETLRFWRAFGDPPPAAAATAKAASGLLAAGAAEAKLGPGAGAGIMRSSAVVNIR
jgi:cell division cycle 20, cofactor of APC complex